MPISNERKYVNGTLANYKAYFVSSLEEVILSDSETLGNRLYCYILNELESKHDRVLAEHLADLIFRNDYSLIKSLNEYLKTQDLICHLKNFNIDSNPFGYGQDVVLVTATLPLTYITISLPIDKKVLLDILRNVKK